MINRRSFLSAAAGAALAARLTRLNAACSQMDRVQMGAITDEISPDLEEALQFCQEYSLKWVELRHVWGKYVTEFTPDDVAKAKDLLAKYKIKVSVIDTEYFKIQLPGTVSKATPKREPADIYDRQEVLLERAMGLARAFSTDKIRVFAFWRVEKPETVFDRVCKELEKGAETARKEKMRLVLENEGACNVATARESVALLNAVKSPGLGLNWDPGNAYGLGEHDTYPEGYRMLDKKRIWHMHVKDCEALPDGRHKWLPVGAGKIDYVAQFQEMLKDGYHGSISMETHFTLPADQGGKKAASTQAVKGMIEAFCKA